MQQIGFKNFRKFKEFPAMDLSPITIFVGENNAGKSTVVKGILAYSDFLNGRQNFDQELSIIRNRVAREDDNFSEDDIKEGIKKQLQNIKFYFNTSYLAHVGTFKRALFNKAEEDVISFQMRLGSMDVEVKVIGDRNDEEAVCGTVSMINIYLNTYKVLISFNLQSDNAQVTFYPCQDFKIDEEAPSRFRKWQENIAKYFRTFDKEYSISLHISDIWRGERYDLIGSLVDSLNIAISQTIYPDTQRDRFLFQNFKISPISSIDDLTKNRLKSFSKYVSSHGEPNEFCLPIPRFLSMRMLNLEYLYAHAVTQTVIYSAKDTNDYLSRTIHEFASQPRHKYKKNFVKKWMKEFGVGTDYEIRSVGGEAHLVYILNKDGERVNLADKGMGSIQLMVLLFRLAITLPNKNDSSERSIIFRNNKVIIIEEPEQNLHPMLQSKLADLFFELNRDYGFRFIIETHSEYLIRRSQVIVGDNFPTEEKLKRNPFKVYYFPSEGNPYDMIYTTSGLFEKKFGDGFINEAGKLHMAILKNAKKKD